MEGQNISSGEKILNLRPLHLYRVDGLITLRFVVEVGYKRVLATRAPLTNGVHQKIS